MAVRVLIVDDDDAFVEALSLLIREHPILEVAATASSTLEADFLMGFARTEEPFDAAVVDFHLGSATGDEIVSTLLRFWPKMVVVGLTGDPDGREAMLRAGAADVLMKDEIVERLFVALGGGDELGEALAYSASSRPERSRPRSQ